MFPELAQSEVILTNTRGIYADIVADHAFALVLSLARELHSYMQNQLEHCWKRSTPVVDLANSILGIIGLGEIGMEVAKRATAFGMQVVAVDPLRAEKPETGRLGSEFTHQVPPYHVQLVREPGLLKTGLDLGQKPSSLGSHGFLQGLEHPFQVAFEGLLLRRGW